MIDLIFGIMHCVKQRDTPVSMYAFHALRNVNTQSYALETLQAPNVTEKTFGNP